MLASVHRISYPKPRLLRGGHKGGERRMRKKLASWIAVALLTAILALAGAPSFTRGKDLVVLGTLFCLYIVIDGFPTLQKIYLWAIDYDSPKQ